MYGVEGAFDSCELAVDPVVDLGWGDKLGTHQNVDCNSSHRDG